MSKTDITGAAARRVHLEAAKRRIHVGLSHPWWRVARTEWQRTSSARDPGARHGRAQRMDHHRKSQPRLWRPASQRWRSTTAILATVMGCPCEEIDHCGQIEDWRSAITFATTLPSVNRERIGFSGDEPRRTKRARRGRCRPPARMCSGASSGDHSGAPDGGLHGYWHRRSGQIL